MKNIKMILTAVVVFAVVGSALAFRPNFIRQFCASQTINSGCGVIMKKIGTGPNNFLEYHAWSGSFSDCVSNRCQDPINLVND